MNPDAMNPAAIDPYDDNPGEHLDLLAVRYITGELPMAEVAAFELRLAEDQAARDAVEFAVQVATAVAAQPVAVGSAAASTQPPALVPPRCPTGDGRRAWRLWAAAVVVVGLGLGLAYNLLRGDRDAPEDGLGVDQQVVEGGRGNDAVSPAESEAAILITTWVALGELASEGPGDVLHVEQDLEATEPEFGRLDAGVAPAWMMQGLSK
jgi:hypothetical protein